MKYGQVLEQESVPEWSLHNVDYNSLKHEIKVHTTRRQATAMAIPGHQDASLRKFEGGLYQELCGQHDRVDLFVNSKADEISRRLRHLADQVQSLIIRCAEDGGSRVPLKRQRRFAKYEREALRCGEEINALSRFTSAQVTAFRKIIKKYKKWTGSQTLGSRFRENVLSNPKSFTKRDYSQLQAQYDDLLNTLRSTATTFSEPSSPESDERPAPLVTTILQADDRRRRREEHAHAEFAPLPPPAPVHYWNEYDDGSDLGGDEDGGYAIYIDPNEHATFPVFAYVQTALALPFEKVKVWFARDRDHERQPLLPATNATPNTTTQGTGDRPTTAASGSPGFLTVGGGVYGATGTTATSTTPIATTETDEDYFSSSDELFPSSGYMAHYAAAFPSVEEQRVARYRERVLLYGTVGCLAASFLLLGTAALLITTGRHKLRLEVDAGVTVVVVASISAACAALGMTMYRRDPLSLMYRLAVWTSFLTSCILNGMLLVLVVGSSKIVP